MRALYLAYQRKRGTPTKQSTAGQREAFRTAPSPKLTGQRSRLVFVLRFENRKLDCIEGTPGRRPLRKNGPLPAFRAVPPVAVQPAAQAVPWAGRFSSGTSARQAERPPARPQVLESVLP